MVSYMKRQDILSRRQFGALSVGAGLVAMLPRVAGAVEVVEENVEIKTPDGVADSYFVHPTTGTHAGVLVWPDAMGLRPAFKQMARRLAESGYSVLVPNPFYRAGKAAAPAPAGTNPQDPAVQQQMRAAMGALNADTHVTDARAFIPWLDSQRSVSKTRKIGTTGYCMGGPITMRTAATFPDRVGAAGSFHGGGLVSDQPNSPHLLVPKIKASYLFAIAESDDMRQPDAKIKLREAFDAAKVPAEIEVYAGTAHGWCPPDSRAYNEAGAEKAWARMLELFKKSLA